MSSYNTWRRNRSGALVHPGKQAATAGKRFVSYFLDGPRCQTEGFSHPIYINKPSATPAINSIITTIPITRVAGGNWPRESIICFYHGRSLM